MKKLALVTVLLSASSSAYADAPGGPNCGWGNMLFEGKAGAGYHFMASTFNSSFGNNTFGMTSGTNGCSTRGRLTYSGKNAMTVSQIMTEFSEDVAKGNGEALDTVAVVFGIDKQDRSVFAEMAHANFEKLFPSENVSAEHVVDTLFVLMKNDARLAKYAV